MKKSEVLTLYKEVKRRRVARGSGQRMVSRGPVRRCGCGGTVKKGMY
ncbi:hypothetical protein [Tuberibacillus calidus]|nr:hypothetical protein [Tuberibacillus calidus]